MEAEANARTVDVLSFTLDGHRVGLVVTDVLEVLRAAAPSPLPRAPSMVLGVLNLRGSLVPVFDIRQHFGLRPRSIRAADMMLVVRQGTERAIIVVEHVHEVVKLPTQRIEVAFGPSGGAPLVRGVVKLDDGTLVIYDLEGFLSAGEQLVLDEVLHQAFEQATRDALGPAASELRRDEEPERSSS